ncbi:MAG: peptidase M23 [Rhodospirillaceae bacterium]|nr:peptidase M23 [Rhodospirillaceae bacterium]
MRRDRQDSGWAQVAGALALVLLIAVGGCTRRGPLAPVEYKGSATYAAPSAMEVTPTAFPPVIDGHVRVAPGDTVYAIARRHGVSAEALIAANRLSPPYTLLVDQVLRMPEEAGRTHTVQPGETVFRIARCKGVDMGALVAMNGIDPPYVIMVGQTLRLPATVAPPSCPPEVGRTDMVATADPPTVPVERTVIEPTERSPVQPEQTQRHPQDSTMTPPAIPAAFPANRPAVIPEPPPRSSGKFLWPVSGKLLSGFGPRPGGGRNDGVNVAADRGTPVRAAESGTVVYAGNELRGYGKMLLIRHADGWISTYAHNDDLLVDRGDVVNRGQVIAHVGSTGGVSSPQMHFELRRGAEAVDPVKHLSWQ